VHQYSTASGHEQSQYPGSKGCNHDKGAIEACDAGRGSVVGVFGVRPGGASRRGHVDVQQFSIKDVGAKHGFTPSQEWLDHIRLSSLRIAGGCSASFISPQGLVMTNHHCVGECVEQLSTAQQNFEQNGFSAKTPAEEKKCPDFELDQLVEIRDVTKDVLEALTGKTGDAANKALNAV
jgi:peptidase S46-like protein